jgi:hypothetical protein
MKAILEYLRDLWSQVGYLGIASIFSAIIASLGVLSGLWQLGAKLWILRRQRKLKRDLFPFYTLPEIQRATQYYVETKCQNIAPSKEDEPRQAHAFAAKEHIIPFFLKKAFKPEKDECQFYIVLADSGMGKTTFLINLYLRYLEQFFGARYQIKLFPLGFPELDKEIEKISDDDKRKTILLLDAFDEDIQAVHDYKTRLHDLIRKVVQFREVVITCRTQFFPSEEEEPKETGVLQFGGEGGYREFRKLYLSPFDDHDVHAYLRKRFFWQVFKRRKAHRIVTSCPNLMVRPMLLSYIDDLLQSQRLYPATYMVYEELIAKWIDREAKRVPSEKREHYRQELARFSREIALDIYRQREARDGALLIEGAEIKPFAEQHGIDLNDMELKSRSLLNRNARGEYKFSHKSILEYFLAVEAFSSESFRQEINFDGMSQAEAFFDELIWEKLTVPFFSQSNLKGEYSLSDGRPKDLATMKVMMLPEVTSLTIAKWNPSENVLLFRGLKKLQGLNFIMTQMISQQQDELHHALPTCQIRVEFLRSEPRTVSAKEFRAVFKLDKNQRPLEYMQHDYEDQGEVVVDHATGLTWEKVGSKEVLTYEKAQAYINQLNDRKFAGYSDWRLPTIPELMSLLEPQKQSNGWYISPIFETPKEYYWCWSVDLRTKGEGSAESAWVVDFYDGCVGWRILGNSHYVRGVRS